jgi:hypothetical protein
MEPNISDRATILLSVQRALLGAVPASLRAVACGADRSTIKIKFIFDGDIDPADYEAAQIVSTEVVADFAKPWTISEEIVRIDAPAILSNHGLEWWAYARRERP